MPRDVTHRFWLETRWQRIMTSSHRKGACGNCNPIPIIWAVIRHYPDLTDAQQVKIGAVHITSSFAITVDTIQTKVLWVASCPFGVGSEIVVTTGFLFKRALENVTTLAWFFWWDGEVLLRDLVLKPVIWEKQGARFSSCPSWSELDKQWARWNETTDIVKMNK